MNSSDMQLENCRALALWAVSFLFMISQCLAGPLRMHTRPANQVSVSANGQPSFKSVPLEGLEYCTTSNEEFSTAIKAKIVGNIPDTVGSRPSRSRAIESLTFKALRIRHSLAPTPIECAALTACYEGAISFIARDEWHPASSSELFTIAYGAFRLTASSLGLPVQRAAMPSRCSLMKERASRCWIQIHDVCLVHEATGIAVAIAEGEAPKPLPTTRSISPTPLTSPPRSSMMHKRATTNDNTLVVRSFRHVAYIAPAQIAASFFEDFYNLIALKVETGVWAAQGTLHSLVFTRWNFRLSFFCYAEPVPWQFVQDFAINMMEMVGRGWTTSYEATYQKLSGLVFVTVKMELLGGRC